MRNFIILAIMALGSMPAMAQSPQLNAVWPMGGPAGSKVTGRLEGGGLAGVNSILVSGKGVSIQVAGQKADGSVPITIDIASDAQPGAHEVRVLAPGGMSAPAYVWVDTVPQVDEKEGNNQPEVAQKLDKLPIAVCGKADGGEDVDWFEFQAKAGDTYVFDSTAYRIYSAIDPFIELRDTENRLLGTAFEGYDRDPRLIHTFKKDGTYRLQIHDTQYRGGGNYLYRLTIGKLPVITSIFPTGGKRGETINAAVAGINLGGMKSLAIQIPADAPEGRPYYIMPSTPAGPALPITVSADDEPQFIETEPDNPRRSPISPTIPSVINGRIGSEREIDRYFFSGAPGSSLDIRVAARSIGSRLDGFLRIFDSTGKELVNTEDQIGRDARVTFNAPSAGVYRLEVTSLDNRAGPDYYYRIFIGPPGGQDYRLTVSPDNFSLGKGQTQVLNVTAVRRGGFDGEISVRVEGAPAGVAITPLLIGPGTSSGIITLTAAADAQVNSGQIRVLSEAMVNGKKVERAPEVVTDLPRPGEGQPVPRIVEFMGAASNSNVPLFSIATEPQKIEIKGGETVMVKVKAARKAGDNNANPAIALSFPGLPSALSAEAPAIAEKAGEQTIKISAVKGTKPRTYYVLLTGKIGDNAPQPAPALEITVR